MGVAPAALVGVVTPLLKPPFFFKLTGLESLIVYYRILMTKFILLEPEKIKWITVICIIDILLFSKILKATS